jgi:hypothetical protein
VSTDNKVSAASFFSPTQEPPPSVHPPELLPRGLSVSDDSSVDSVDSSDSSQPSLFTPCDDFFTPPAAPAPTLRRAANPSVLNDDWRTFFRDALTSGPTEPVTAVAPVPNPLPPPLTKAPNLPCGHPFLPDHGQFRVWSNNINGLSADNGFAALHELCIALKPHNVGAIALQETNLDFTQSSIRDSVQTIFREHFGAVQLVTSTSCLRSPSTWKPGGVLLAVLGKWSHSVTSTSGDDLGRWASATFSGRDGHIFTLYSLYNCVDARITDVGPTTAFAQQWQLLRLAGVQHPKPRLQCVQDLSRDIQARHRNDEDIMVVGDFNETLGKDPTLMASVCAKHSLYDVVDHVHGPVADIPTYIRGSRRLDYCLLSSHLQARLHAVGFNLFNEFASSDHRALFLDFDLLGTLGKPNPTIVPPSKRFVSSRSDDVCKFVAKMADHLQQNKVFHKFSAFLVDCDAHAKPWELANDIDSMLGHAFETAERHCASPERPPWSAKLHIASLKVRYWQVALTARLTQVPQDDVLNTLAKQIWASPPRIPFLLRSLRSVATAARRALRRIRRDAYEERKTFLEELKARIALRLSPKDTDQETALKSINRQLKDANMFQRIRRSVKPVSQPALIKVEIVHTTSLLDPTTGEAIVSKIVQVVDTRAELEAAIIARNKRHFSQASNTPFAQPPLQCIGSDNAFNIYEDAAGSKILLPPTAFPETQLVMDILQERAEQRKPSWSAIIDFEEDFIPALLHWRERTSTSPSGRHLGLYKALATAYCNSSNEFSVLCDDDDPYMGTVQEQAESILRIIHGLASKAAELGFYLRRWLHVVNIMIYKKANCLELDRLRVIHLFEADFNLLVGVLFGRRAMYHQVDNQLLHPGQYGRPGGECQDAALLKVLHNHLAKYTQTSMGQFESDATACFDRMVMNFVLLCFRTNGAPMGPLRMWEQTLYHIIHKVKTAYGTTDASYSYTATSPIIGPGQGSRGGPAGCSTITSPLIECMDKLCHGISFSDPLQSIQYVSTVSMFIDDASNATNSFLPWLHEPPDDSLVVTMLQHDAQRWERLLWSSGGLLNLQKCLFYIMAWEFDEEGRASLKTESALPNPLQLTSGAAPDLQSVTQYDSTKAHRYLGDWISCSLQMTTALSVLQENASNYGRRVLTSPLSKRDAWIAYYAVFIPSISYTFPVTHHSDQRLRKLQSAPTRSTLSKIGFNRNTPHAVVFGPTLYNGLAMRDLPVEQGIAQLQILMRHIRAGSTQGDLFLITLSWWQQLAGVSYALLENTSPSLPFLDADLPSSIRHYLSTIKGSVHIPTISKQLPTPLRDNDQCLMEAFLALKLRRAVYKACQRVRLYLGITFISEITSADGTRIARDAWTGNRVRYSSRLWPYQPRPGPKSFRHWRRTLATAFLSGVRRRVCVKLRDLRLARPLGVWLPQSEWLRSKWSFFYSRSSLRLYDASGTSYSAHPARKIRTRPRNPVRSFAVSTSTVVSTLPSDAVPVDVTVERDRYCTPVHIPGLQPSAPIPPPPSTWASFLESLPVWERSLFPEVKVPDLPALLEALTSNADLFLASDGGAVPLKGSFGAVLATSDTILVECGGRAYGQDPRSFRSEAYGMLAVTRLLFHLRAFHQLQMSRMQLTLVCDSLSLLDRLSASRKLTRIVPRRFLFSEADAEMAILDTFRELKADLVLQHVESHQDTKHPNRPPTWAAILNTRCDVLASKHLDAATDILRSVPFLPASKISLDVDGVTITHHLPSQLRRCSNSPSLRDYLCRHHQWDGPEFDLVRWESLQSAALSQSFLKRLFLVKWTNDLLPFQVQQHKFGYSPVPSCPSHCGEDEDWSHFLRCAHPERRQLWMEFHKTTMALLERWSVDPSLRRLVLALLATFVSKPSPPMDNLAPEYTILLEQQHALGANSLFFGFLPSGWYTLQHRYLVARALPRDKNQVDNWMKAFIRNCHDFCHALWLLRNSHLHGKAPGASTSYKHLHLLAQIEELYDTAPHMLAHDRDIFALPFETRQLQSTRTLRTFYTFAKPIVEKSIREAQDFGMTFRRIDEYFSPAPPPAIPLEIFEIILGNSCRI